MGVQVFNSQGGLELSLPPVPLKLPELIQTLCPRCGGAGGEEYVSVRGDDVTEPCPERSGTGYRFVCPTCGETPTGDADLCGCNTLTPGGGHHD